MPRFVVLQHDHPKRLHWDFMLDQGHALLTWALPLPPCYDHALAVQALPDHRRAYLDYEGPVSGDRGSVVQWDAGDFQWIERTDDRIVVALCGLKLLGRARIEAAGPDVFRWFLTRRG